MNHTSHNPIIRITKAERDEALNSADRAMKAFREHQKEKIMATPKMEVPAELASEKLYRMEEVAAVAGVGRGMIYEHARKGKLRTVKIGRLRRVRATDLREYIASMLSSAPIQS